MAKSRQVKVADGKAIGDRLNRAAAAVVSEYEGATAEELAALRRKLREVDGEFQVVRNRVAKKSLGQEAATSAELAGLLKGPVGVTYMYGDVAAGAKTLLDFAKENKNLKVTGGIMNGKALSASELKALSELPSKDVLLAQIVGSIVAPHRGLLTVLSGVSRNLVQVLGAIKDKKVS